MEFDCLDRRLPAAAAVTLLAAVSSGCVMLDKSAARYLFDYEAQVAANQRLMILAVVCLMGLPIAGWAGLVWGTKTLSLRSWWALLTVECVLLGMLVAAWSYFT